MERWRGGGKSGVGGKEKRVGGGRDRKRIARERTGERGRWRRSFVSRVSVCEGDPVKYDSL